MPLEVISRETNPPNPLLDLEITQDQHEQGFGVILTAQSAPFEELFKKLSKGNVSKDRDGVSWYTIPPTVERGNYGRMLYASKSLVNEENGVVNLSFLRLQGLADGVSVFFPGIFEKDYLQNYTQMLQQNVGDLYRRLSPSSSRIRMYVD